MLVGRAVPEGQELLEPLGLILCLTQLPLLVVELGDEGGLLALTEVMVVREAVQERNSRLHQLAAQETLLIHLHRRVIMVEMQQELVTQVVVVAGPLQQEITL